MHGGREGGSLSSSNGMRLRLSVRRIGRLLRWLASWGSTTCLWGTGSVRIRSTVVNGRACPVMSTERAKSSPSGAKPATRSDASAACTARTLRSHADRHDAGPATLRRATLHEPEYESLPGRSWLRAYAGTQLHVERHHGPSVIAPQKRNHYQSPGHGHLAATILQRRHARPQA